MSKETISYTENNFDPLNKAIDESIREQGARIAWQYAKVFGLVLVSIGILAVLLAWAYNIFKKPNPDLTRKINEIDKKFEQSKSLDEKEEKIIDGEVIKYNSETLRFLSAKSGKFSILTRFTYSTTKDLLEGNKPNKITCYMTDGSIDFEFETPKEIQKENLELLGITYAQAKTYQKYCQYNNY
tara:strand:+ start:1894 stop:2445 length:552 start_codon:yes stop_codon:yes gene_type:complete